MQRIVFVTVHSQSGVFLSVHVIDEVVAGGCDDDILAVVHVPDDVHMQRHVSV